MAQFELHIGIDYSGAKTATSRLPNLQVYQATTGRPAAVIPPADMKALRPKWTRQSIAEWLTEQILAGPQCIVGIDHAFSFPMCYFERYDLGSWPEFLADFIHHWPTYRPETSVDSIRKDPEKTLARTGEKKDFRLTEKWTTTAKSVFLFDVRGSVAKSSHTGIPWLAHLREKAGDRIHFWPFDGWEIAASKSVVAEVYPSLFRQRYSLEDCKSGRTGAVTCTQDEFDAYSTARWLTEMDRHGFLSRYFDPCLTSDERHMAEREGWILGVA